MLRKIQEVGDAIPGRYMPITLVNTIVHPDVIKANYQ